VIKSKVISANGQKVILEDNTEITDFDYLFLCTGSRYDLDSLTINQSQSGEKAAKIIRGNEGADYIHAVNDIAKAKRFAVIGSGPVGIEILGELLEKYPKTETVLISADSTIMKRASPNSHEAFYKYLSKKKNLKMILGQRVTEIQGNKIKTDKGATIDADVIFVCTGFKPNTEYAVKGMPQFVDSKGYLKVNEYLQVGDYKTVFGLGDCIDADTEKLGQNILFSHVPKIIKTLQNIEMGEKPVAHKPETRQVLVSIGPKYGIMVTDKKVIAKGWLMGMLKKLLYIMDHV